MSGPFVPPHPAFHVFNVLDSVLGGPAGHGGHRRGGFGGRGARGGCGSRGGPGGPFAFGGFPGWRGGVSFTIDDDVFGHGPGAFAPKFDLYETDKDYVIQGDVPGVEMDKVNVQWDKDALKINGSYVKNFCNGPAQQAGDEANETNVNETETTAVDVTDEKTKGKQAAVEDDPEDAVVVDADTDMGDETAAAEKPSSTEQEKSTSDNCAAECERHGALACRPKEGRQCGGRGGRGRCGNREGRRYLVSERHAGEFSRSFTFDSPVDPDNITATLTNGVLEVHVPKTAVPAARRIQIQQRSE